ncbi:MAG: RND family transporter [Pseudomonadales bacterium]
MSFKWVLQYRYLVIIACLVLVALAATGNQHLRFNPDLRSLYDQQHPIVQQLALVEEEFTKRDQIIVVLSVEQGTVYQPEIVELIQILTDRAWQMPYASRVDSLTNFQYTFAEGDDLIVSDLVPIGEHADPMILRRLQHVANTDPALQRAVVSSEGDVTAVNISFQAQSHKKLMLAMPEFVGATQAMVNELAGQYPHVTFRLSGNHAVNFAIQAYAQNDSSVLIPSMLLVMALILLVLLRSVYACFACVVVVVATGASTMGIFGWLGLETEIVSIIAPIVVMTLAVADAVHVVNGAIQGRSNGLNQWESILSSLTLNFQPIFLTSLATIFGVITFSFTDFPPLRKLAVIIAVGVSIAFALSITLLPAMLSLRPLKNRRNAKPGPVLTKLAGVSTQYSKTIALCCVPIAALVVWLVPMNVMDESPRVFFEKQTPERQVNDFVEEKLAGVVSTEIAIYGDGPDSVMVPEFLDVVDRFVAYVRDRDDISYAASITDTLKRLNRSLNEDDESFYRLPESRELAAQLLLLYELSLPTGMELTNQLNIDKSATLVSVMRSSSTAEAAVRLNRETLEWFEREAPELKIAVTGVGQSASELAYTYLIPSMLKGGVIAILTVCLILLFALRSVRLGLLGMLATCFPIAVGYAGWAVYSGILGFAVSAVAGICLGVVVDFSIHFLSKYRAAKVMGQTTVQAIEFAYDKVSRAIWITMIVLVSGFWVLTRSDIGLNSDLGLLTGFVILLSAFFNLLVLPALLVLFDGKTMKGSVV